LETTFDYCRSASESLTFSLNLSIVKRFCKTLYYWFMIYIQLLLLNLHKSGTKIFLKGQVRSYRWLWLYSPIFWL